MRDIAWVSISGHIKGVIFLSAMVFVLLLTLSSSASYATDYPVSERIIYDEKPTVSTHQLGGGINNPYLGATPEVINDTCFVKSEIMEYSQPVSGISSNMMFITAEFFNKDTKIVKEYNFSGEAGGIIKGVKLGLSGDSQNSQVTSNSSSYYKLTYIVNRISKDHFFLPNNISNFKGVDNCGTHFIKNVFLGSQVEVSVIKTFTDSSFNQTSNQSISGEISYGEIVKLVSKDKQGYDIKEQKNSTGLSCVAKGAFNVQKQAQLCGCMLGLDSNQFSHQVASKCISDISIDDNTPTISAYEIVPYHYYLSSNSPLKEKYLKDELLRRWSFVSKENLRSLISYLDGYNSRKGVFSTNARSPKEFTKLKSELNSALDKLNGISGKEDELKKMLQYIFDVTLNFPVYQCYGTETSDLAQQASCLINSLISPIFDRTNEFAPDFMFDAKSSVTRELFLSQYQNCYLNSSCKSISMNSDIEYKSILRKSIDSIEAINDGRVTLEIEGLDNNYPLFNFENSCGTLPKNINIESTNLLPTIERFGCKGVSQVNLNKVSIQCDLKKGSTLKIADFASIQPISVSQIDGAGNANYRVCYRTVAPSVLVSPPEYNGLNLEIRLDITHAEETYYERRGTTDVIVKWTADKPYKKVHSVGKSIKLNFLTDKK